MTREDISIRVRFESLEQAEKVVQYLVEQGLQVEWFGPKLSEDFLETIIARRSTGNRAHGKIVEVA